MKMFIVFQESIFKDKFCLFLKGPAKNTTITIIVAVELYIISVIIVFVLCVNIKFDYLHFILFSYNFKTTLYNNSAKNTLIIQKYNLTAVIFLTTTITKSSFLNKT